MFRATNDILGFTLGARDGEIGRVKDFYFEDQHWVIRYLVADTNKWLPGRKVLLTPHAVKGFSADDRIVNLNLTCKQVADSPSMDEDKPVSRQYEEAYYAYYNWPYYWQGAGLWGPMGWPTADYSQAAPLQPNEHKPEGDPHLRSIREVSGYAIHGSDHQIGHLDDLLFDDHDWVIRHLVVDTRHWWPGEKVLVSVDWVSSVSFEESEIRIDLARDKVRSAPEYDSKTPVTREYEARLYQHYGREPYWFHRMAA